MIGVYMHRVRFPEDKLKYERDFLANGKEQREKQEAKAEK
jgi:hypothetical protein